jgi:hypothetical protein
MRLSYLGLATLTAALAAGRAGAAPVVTGQYVESRSANVYVGACHREGELLTAGRNAVLAWNITDGDWNGVGLKGMTAVAVVAGDKNLYFEDAKRRSVLYVNDLATSAQRDALVSLLKERAPAALGELVAVKSVPITFDASGDLFRVHAAGVAQMKIKKQAGQLCCKQPYEVWGKPFVPVKAAKTGYCMGVEFKDPGLLQAWSATDQNNAFYGDFSL